jgi:hypothetical protein
VAESLTPDKLLDLYRLALDEYRFEVRLGWDRTTYFLALNSAILGVATGLLKLDNPPAVYLFIALLFILGLGTSTIGSISIKRNHEYYRRTIVKKTLFENRLGLTDAIADMNPSLNMSIGTTPGQGGYLRILEDPEKYVSGKLRPHSITFWLRSIFIALAIVDLIGAASSILMMIYGSHSGHLTSFRSLFKP